MHSYLMVNSRIGKYPWDCQILTQDKEGHNVSQFCLQLSHPKKEKRGVRCNLEGAGCVRLAKFYDRKRPFHFVEQFRVTMSYSIDIPDYVDSKFPTSIEFNLDTDPRSYLHIHIQKEAAHVENTTLHNRFKHFPVPCHHLKFFAKNPILESTKDLPISLVLFQMKFGINIKQKVSSFLLFMMCLC